MQRITDLEKHYVLDVLSSHFKTSSGAHYMNRFESEFSKKYTIDFSISQINGTATLHSCLEAMEIGAGDEVIVPPLTMASTSLAVLQANATPIFADIDPDTFLIDPVSIEKNITKHTKAIITVALYGLSPDMDKIIDIAKQHNLYIIEDNAQAFLSYYKNKLVGTLGDCASFSFQSSKHLTSGEGGIVITRNENLAMKIRKISGLGYTTINAKKAKITKDEIQYPSFLRHDMLGWNYRLSELNAAVALAQTERMNELVSARRKSAEIFLEVLDNCKWLVPQYIPKFYTSSYWALACKLDLNVVSWEKFREIFLQYGGDKFYGAWQLTYLEPLFLNKLFLKRKPFINQDYKKGLCPIAEKIQPALLQFKTNYWDTEQAKEQAKILEKTVSYFSR